MLTIMEIGDTSVRMHWGFLVILTLWVVFLAPFKTVTLEHSFKAPGTAKKRPS